MKHPHAFTLVELLVVIGIVVLLAAILMPVVTRARASANRTRCAAQLQDVGRMLQMYFGENKNTLPQLNMMPSLKPPLNAFPSLSQLLGPYYGGGKRALHCPADQITQPATGAPPGYLTYYDREGASYRWNAALNLRATRITNLRSPEKVSLVDEYESFHGPEGASGSMNHLFADFHVDSVKGSDLVIIIKTS